MAERSERLLKTSPVFCSEDESLCANRENMPWPSKGDSLLAETIGSEEFVYPYTEWIDNDLSRLSFFALQYRDCARELVRLWLKTKSRPDNLVYVVGFLYRHAIELELKAILVRGRLFQESEDVQQRKLLGVHSLKRLWCDVRPVVEASIEDGELETFSIQLLQLHELDKGSDGFRYPFGFIDRQGARKELLDRLPGKSFDNFVWVLDGLVSWLQTAADIQNQYREII